MKKFSFLPILLFFSLVLVLPSCKDDDDGPGQNEFVLDGEKFSLAKGYIEDYGDNGNGSFDFDVTLTSSDITKPSGDIIGRRYSGWLACSGIKKPSWTPELSDTKCK